MNHFDINSVIEHYKLDVKELAKVLFPRVQYPDAALGRILKGESVLGTDQLEKLAEYAGVPTIDLFGTDTWKGGTEDGCMTLTKGDYKVKLNYKGTYMTLYKGRRVVRKCFVDTSTPLEEFIEHINNLIKYF